MSDILSFLFNPYNRKARLQPALLSLLPVFFVVILLIPEFRSLWAAIVGFVIYCGGTTLLMQLGRDRGKTLEPMLFRSWGGKPSVAMLRHHDRRLSRSTKERYRAFLERAIPGLKLASPEDEQELPEQADDGYEDATSWLLAQTRDRGRFGLIFQENINYGFRRNIWAFKPYALVSDALAIVGIAAIESASWTGEFISTLPLIGMPAWVCMVLIVMHISVFSFIIRPNWIRLPAEAYARQLLAACDMFDNEHICDSKGNQFHLQARIRSKRNMS